VPSCRPTFFGGLVNQLTKPARGANQIQTALTAYCKAEISERGRGGVDELQSINTHTFTIYLGTKKGNVKKIQTSSRRMNEREASQLMRNLKGEKEKRY